MSADAGMNANGDARVPSSDPEPPAPRLRARAARSNGSVPSGNGAAHTTPRRPHVARRRAGAPKGTQALRVAIAYDLKEEVERETRDPLPTDDAFEEYDGLDTVHAIRDALERDGHRATLIGGGRALLRHALRSPTDLVFNIAEGRKTRSREGHVPSVLEMLDIPYTHSDPLTLSLTLEKSLAKRVVASSGVATPPFAVLHWADQVDALSLRYPVIPKPLAEGSSMGIRDHSRVSSPAELRALLEGLLPTYRQPVLVEEFCSGPEFTVGILGTGMDAEVLGVMEILPADGNIEAFVYSLEAKRNWRERIVYHAPPQRDAAVVKAVGDVALAAYRALDCRDVGRVDVRLGADGTPYFIELNPLPGLNPISGDLVLLAEGHGVSYPELIARIVRAARTRLGI